ncbi:MAG: hypothetical protein Fur0022_15650 [Anaerolineales bacterium]
MTQKLYCYVDETGQDTKGELFIVAVVVTGEEREALRQACEHIEQESGKGNRKWHKTKSDRQVAYIQQLVDTPVFVGKIYFAIFRSGQDYLSFTVQTIARTLQTMQIEDYRAVTLIDALPHGLERAVGALLRPQNIRSEKVRGVRKDENDPLIRLADGVCGWIRSALEEQKPMKMLYQKALQRGLISNVSDKKNPRNLERPEGGTA